jgi:intein/homing endonuclease
MINILVLNIDNDGVGYWRILNSHIAINDPDIHIELRSMFDHTLPILHEEYLRNFQIVVYNKKIAFKDEKSENIFDSIIKKYNIKRVYDIDDHWRLNDSHLNYRNWKHNNGATQTVDELKKADYITTTSPIFEKDIKEVNENVIVLPNAVNLKEHQWLDKKVKSDKIRFLWGGGISHMPDLRLLKESFGSFDKDFLQKAQLYLCGFDLRMKTNEGVAKSDWRNSPWTFFEDIFTNNYKYITNNDYRQWLQKYEDGGKDTYGINPKFINEFYQRRFTKPILLYGTQYNECDVALAPLKSGLLFNQVKCITGDSLISTNKGFIKIEDIVNNKINAKVKIYNKYYNIINYFKYENEDTIKITTKDGYNIEGTLTHRILIDNEWVYLKDLKIGDKIQLTTPDINQNDYQTITYPMLLTKNNEEKLEKSDETMLPKIEINERWGRLLGYLLGDGHMGEIGNVSISCDIRDDDVVDDVFSLFESIGLKPNKCRKIADKRCKTSLVKYGFGVDVKLTSKTFVNIAKKYNWINNKGKVFRIPDVILKSPKNVIKEFLKGLFEADATVGENSCVTFTSKDLKLVEQVQILLLPFNIQSTIYYKFNKHYRRYYYSLDLRRIGSEIFHKEIGFISRKKTEKLQKLTENKHSNNEHKQNMYDYVDKIQFLKNDVYDIEIEDVHSYNANGIINHNSQLKVVEAGAHHCPIIASNFGPYTIDDIEGKNDNKPKGFLINEDDKMGWYNKMKWFVDNPNAIKDYGENLYEYVRDNYSIDVVNKKRIDFYKSIIK